MLHTTLAPDFPRTILDTIDEIVYALELSDDTLTQARVTFVSERVRDVLGFTPEEFIENRGLWVTLVHPADLASLEQASREILESGRPGRRYFRIRHKTRDEYVWLEDSIVPQVDAMGTVIGAARDVTARRRSLLQMTFLMENTRDGFFMLDSDLRCTYVNPAGAAMFGGKAADMHGHRITDFLVEPNRTAFAATAAEAVARGEVVRRSGFCHTLNRWLDLAIFPGPDGVVLSLRDVTEQRTSEERLRTWVDEAPVGLFRTIPNGQMLDANGTALAMLGYPSLDRLREQQALDLIADTEDPASAQIDFSRVDRLTGIPVTLRRLDGSPIPVLMNLRTVRDHAGQAVEVLGSFEDRSDPATLRSALLSSARRYRILFDENVTPMVLVSADGTMLSRNKAFLRLVGASDATLQEQTGAFSAHLATPEAFERWPRKSAPRGVWKASNWCCAAVTDPRGGC
ncbi:MAG: PAS domain S-box protein [Vicinamibacterales bacterium]